MEWSDANAAPFATKVGSFQAIALAACLAARAAVGAESEFRATDLPPRPAGNPGFSLLRPAQTGVWFTNTLSPANAAANQIRLNGSGVALGDVDGDGRCDLFASALEGPVALYRNLGDWRFTNVAAAAGLDFPGHYSTGAVLADVDGDRDLDLLLNGIGTGTRLFRNDGHGQFAEANDSGLLQRFGATTSSLADIDGDGDLDLYVANYRTNTVRSTGFALLNVGGRRMVQPQDRGHLELTPEGRVLEHGEPHVLYRNIGQGRFRPASWTDGTFLDEDGQPLKRPPFDWGLSCAFRDLNGDGAPDLYVCNDFHSPDRVWLNDGQGRFRALPRLALRHTATFSMAVDFADVDRDGRDDILVSDMTSRERGRRLMQIAGMDPYSIGMGVFEDRPQLDRTVLQWNRGDGTYADVACYAGLENSEWNWSVLFLDVDLDGFEDLLAATGHMFDTQDLDALAQIASLGPFPREKIPQKLLLHPPLAQANLAFRNRGNLTFAECSAAWGFDQVGVSQGMALGDLDGDGDLDLVVNNLNLPLGIYRNDSTAPRLAVRLNGHPPNTAGIGARLTVTGGPVTQTHEMMAGGRYLSSDQTLRVFAAVSAGPSLQIEVRWRDGQRTIVTNALPDRLYEIRPPGQSSTAGLSAPPPTTRQPLPPPNPHFEDVSALLDHRHQEQPFDDFARQPLLPRRLSQGGPGVSWFDLDADGWEDLVVGSGKGGTPALLRNKGTGGFEPLYPPWNEPLRGDLTTILGCRLPDWPPTLLAGVSHYEMTAPADSSILVWQSGHAPGAAPAPAFPASTGPLALADYDADGQLDLFVGGRTLPGRYPEPAASQFWRWRDERWNLDAENSAQLVSAGMVSGAAWSDLDGDGWPELLLACDWGPLRILRNHRGQFEWWDPPVQFPPRALANQPRSGDQVAHHGSDPERIRTPRSAVPSDGPDLNAAVLTLRQLTGWWNGVASGDFNGDGALDFVATNWGLNSPYRASPDAPFALYYGDFDESGSVHLIEASYDPVSGQDLPERDFGALAAVMPWLRARFASHAAFGQATVGEILGPAKHRARRLEVNTLASTLFLNRTSHFEVVPLPFEAQLATAFAACVGDFDGDGDEDLFLSQNFFATHAKFPRCDAGLGLWLRGDGRGLLEAVPASASGVRVFGEQRGSALADYDADGRLDLVVTQNGNATRLFRNVRARPGLRVRLAGPAGNATGVGAVLRLVVGDDFGPAHLIGAGSGYWSQESSVAVLGAPRPPTGLWVRWPGGKVSQVRLPPRVAEVEVSHDSSVRILRER